MAKSKLPRPIERRHLVARELSAAQARRYADAYLEAGRDQDAVEFLVKAEASEQLAAIRQRAVESGDVFLFRTVASATGVAPEQHEWRALSAAAEAAGKPSYASEARRQAERGDGES